MYYVVLDLSDALLLDGEAQRALPAKGHRRVEVSCEGGQAKPRSVRKTAHPQLHKIGSNNKLHI